MISSYCNWGECLDVQLNSAGRVVVSSTFTGLEASFTEAEWDAFVRGVKAGEFDVGRLRAGRENPQVNARRPPAGNDSQMITGEHPLRPRDAEHAYDWLYERAEDAFATGMPLESALGLVRNAHSSIQVDRDIAENGA